MDLTEFRVRIEDAFKEVPYPGDDHITGCTTCSSICYECDATVNYFRGRTSHGHNAIDLRYHEEALSFFTNEALHYYLPAFVLAVLEDPEEADIIYDGLIFHFSPATSSRHQRNIERLSDAQRAVMIEYFQYCLDEYGEYLDDYIARAIAALRERTAAAS